MLAIVVPGFLCAAAPVNLAAVPVSRMGEPWWRARFIAKQTELAKKQVELVWLGDSITQDWELAGPQPWKDFAPIWQRFYGDRHAINLGFRGDSTCHILWRLQHGELSGIHPKLMIMLIGANNFGHIHTNAATTFDGVKTIVDGVHQKLPQTQLLLLGVLPSVRSAWVSENTQQLNRMLDHAAKTKALPVTFMDISDLFMNGERVDSGKFMDPLLRPPDPPLHPTAASQERIAERIEPVVAGLLEDRLHR